MPSYKHCCNPLKKVNHARISKSVFKVSDKSRALYPEIGDGKFICNSCHSGLRRKRASCVIPEAAENIHVVNNDTACVREEVSVHVEMLTESSDSGNSDEEFEVDHEEHQRIIIDSLNQTLPLLGQAIIPSDFNRQSGAEKRKVIKAITEAITNTFEASAAKRTRRSSVSMNSEQLVEEFYRSDEISRIMPGKKDCVSVKIDGVRQNIQKRLILANLKEIFADFKEKFPDVKIGLSKFAEFRPRECVLAGSNGTHAVCVCKIHQNVILKLLGIKAFELPDEFDACSFPKDYSQILSATMCETPTPLCHLGECPDCPGIEHIQLHLQEICDINSIDSVTYMTWTSTDRSELIKRTDDIDVFITDLCTDLKTLQQHDFIAKSQHAFLNKCKTQLQPGEFIMLSDFAENYSFLVQDAVQGYHWTKDQVTVHPIIVYHKDGNELKHDSFVIISESLDHDTTAVHLFTRKVINLLRIKYSRIEKIIYFSDGASSQYKNRKNFMNLVYHQSDFGASAEWHFFATSHGKSPCDGLGGTLKRSAARASLQRPYENQITTPQHLYEFAKESIHSIHSIFCTYEEHAAEAEALKIRFNNASTISGTRQFHSYIPISDTHSLQCRIYSLDDEFEVHSVHGKNKKGKITILTNLTDLN